MATGKIAEVSYQAMTEPVIRKAVSADLPYLIQIETLCFDNDRLSKRRFQHWLKASNGLFLVAEHSNKLVGYGLVLLHKGTRLARLYSLAISPNARGLGIGRKLVEALEVQAENCERLFMRLEVAKNNDSAIQLYQQLGYRTFGEYPDYYEDHADALRMQKRIRNVAAQQVFHPLPWYQQTTDFTCGPASLMMAMASLDETIVPQQRLELDIWREATTIFMTSGHGGCHPVGLALAAQQRGFESTVYVNSEKPLFIEGVRSEHKKAVMSAVDQTFREKAAAQGVNTVIADLTQDQIQTWLQQDFAVIVLISTYRLDGHKGPHWVTITAMDDVCFYVHDPDLDEEHQDAMDCQHIPIAKGDFAKMSSFGSERLRTAVAIRKVA